MQTVKAPAKQFYNEQEAARALGISVSTLHGVLDRFIFNDGISRPPNLELMFSDLLLLSYWIEQQPELKAVTVH